MLVVLGLQLRLGLGAPLLPAGAALASGEDASRSSMHIGKWVIAPSGAGCKSFMFLPDLGFLAKVVVRVHANGHPEGGICQLMSVETFFFPVCVYGILSVFPSPSQASLLTLWGWSLSSHLA